MKKSFEISLLSGLIMVVGMFSQLLAEDDEFVIRQGYEIRTYVDGTTRTVPFRLTGKQNRRNAPLIQPL